MVALSKVASSPFGLLDLHVAVASPVSASQLSAPTYACNLSSPAAALAASSKLWVARHEDDKKAWHHALPGRSSVAHSGAGGKRGSLRSNADTGGSGTSPDSNVQATLDQSKRLLAMQRELLEQVEERKKLYSAIVHHFDSPADSKDQTPAEEESKEGQAAAAVGRNPVASAPSRSWPSSPPASRQTPPPGLMWQSRTTSTSGKPISSSPVQPISSPNQPVLLPSQPFRSPVQPATLPSMPGSSRVLFEPKQKADSEGGKETDALLPQLTTEDAEAGEADAQPPVAGPNVMNIVMVAAECAPWSKTGGLGDVVGALPKALARRGHRVMVVAPRYANYSDAWETGIRRTYNVAGQDMEVGYFHGYINGVDYVFVDHHAFHACSGNIYGGTREEVLHRMILLCKASVEAPWHVPCGGVPYGDGNLVFIANDWHTALLPVYLQAYYRDNGLMEFTRSVLVIHNMAHQGRGPMSDFAMLGLPSHYFDKFRLFDPIGGEHCNIFMAGLITAHRIVAVSHGYAWECQTQEGGWGLDGVIRENNWKLKGVVNGIDDQEWNPEIDLYLKSDGYANYSIGTLETGKAACKAALQKELGLPIMPDVPMIGFIGRLDYQKGVDIIAQAMPWMMEQDLQLVMLGTGRADLEDMLRTFEGHHRNKVRGWVGFSVKTAHRITAGVDILIMPSRFEPCGLNQLYAMRYGTVPVVHSVGGLRDTVQPFDPYSDTGLGWTFEHAEASGLIHALGNAMWTYQDFKPSWSGIQKRGMSQDLSWDNAAEHYEDVLLAAKYQW